MLKVLNPAQITEVWQSIHENDYIPEGLFIPPEVRLSWERSKRYGVDQYKEQNDTILSEHQLKEKLEQNWELLSVAIPHMEVLHTLTKDAGFVITISDNEGYILKRVGKREPLEFTDYANFIEGSNWSEQVMGTNAVGMVLVTNAPSQIYGYEHFCKCACQSTCSAAPINGPNGEILGVLDITGPCKYANAHTLGMVVSSARSIERALIINHALEEIKHQDTLKCAIMNSIAEGLLSLDSEGNITLINPQACKMLNLKEDCVHKNIREVLPKDNHYFFNLIATGKHVYGETIHLDTNRGKKKFLVNCTPIENQHKTTIGLVITLHELHHVVTKIMGAKSSITFDNLIGETAAFRKAVEHAKMAAESDSNVLLLGESGVGKDLFAKAIHNYSIRSHGPFFAINCAAIPRELISSELFGYNEGAFTGASKGGKPGAFELADQGTLFLDEIGEMPIELQASLLRVLEEKTIMRIGGREFIPVNIRLISATNRDLSEEIKKHTFRQDIYYRLSVISIAIPPLRQRIGDIPLLVDHFVKYFGKRLGKRIKRVDSEVMDLFINYEWPGNVRELSNAIERAINLTKNNVISVDLLTSDILGDSSNKPISIWANTITKDNMEEEMIRAYMQKFGNNKVNVAKALNISRSSLYRKMKKYGIKSN